MRSGAEAIKYPMMNNVAISLDLLGAFIKSRIVSVRDGSLAIIICEHGPLYQKAELLKKLKCPKYLEGSMHHSTLFGFNTGEGDNMLLFTLPRHKVFASQCEISINRLQIITISPLPRVRVGLHAKMTMSQVEKTRPRACLR